MCKISLCICSVSVCLSVYACTLRSHGARVTGSCEALDLVLEQNLDSLQKEHALLTTATSPDSKLVIFKALMDQIFSHQCLIKTNFFLNYSW